MKDYITKKDPNLEALIARYKEPEPTVEPEPEHQASVTFVDAGGKPIPQREPEYTYDILDKRTEPSGAVDKAIQNFADAIDKRLPDFTDRRSQEQKDYDQRIEDRYTNPADKNFMFWFIVVVIGLSLLGFGGGESCMIGRANVC